MKTYLSIVNQVKKVSNLLSSPTIKNVFIVATITVGIKLVAFFKETIIASTYGLSEFLDAFFIAILVPSFIQSVFINSFKSIFIPNYIAEQKGEKQIGEFLAVTMIVLLLIILLTTGITFLLSDYFLAYIYPGHSEKFYELVKIQLYYLLPCLFFWGISSFLGGLLEIKSKFLLSSISGFFSPIIILLCIFFFKSVLGVRTLAVGTLIASFSSFTFLLVISLIQRNIVLKKPVLNENTKIMLKQLPAKVSSGFLTGMNNYVDQYFAAQLMVGSIAALNYGIKIPSFILSFSMLALGNVLLPYFSKKILENALNTYKQLFKILKKVFIGGLLFSALVFIFSNNIIEFLFEKNEFTSEDTLLVANIQRIILIYIPFYLCGNILVKFLTSINKNKFMAWQSFYRLAANIILNILLIREFGIYGLALSTTIVITINSILYLAYTYKQYKLVKLANDN